MDHIQQYYTGEYGAWKKKHISFIQRHKMSKMQFGAVADI